MSTDHLTAAEVAAILEAVENGIDDYDGGDIATDIARRLLAAGWTAAECDDDTSALAEFVVCGLPDPAKSHYWPTDKLAREITDDLVHGLIRQEVSP